MNAMTGALFAVTTPLVLAAGQSNNNQGGGQGQEFGSSSPLAFVVLVLFLVAVAFLGRSMAKHLKRVQKNFAEPATGGATVVESAQRGPESDGEDAVSEPAVAPVTTTSTEDQVEKNA